MRRVFLLLIVFSIAAYAQAAHSVSFTITQGTGNTGDPPTSYNVKRATVTGGPYATVASVAITGTSQSFTDTAVVAGQTYFYVATEVNSGGETGVSNQITCTIPFQAPTSPPSLSAPTVK